MLPSRPRRPLRCPRRSRRPAARRPSPIWPGRYPPPGHRRDGADDRHGPAAAQRTDIGLAKNPCDIADRCTAAPHHAGAGRVPRRMRRSSGFRRGPGILRRISQSPLGIVVMGYLPDILMLIGAGLAGAAVALVLVWFDLWLLILGSGVF